MVSSFPASQRGTLLGNLTALGLDLKNLDIEKTKIKDLTAAEFSLLVSAVYATHGYEKGTIIPENAPKSPPKEPEPHETWASRDTLRQVTDAKKQISPELAEGTPAPDTRHPRNLAVAPESQIEPFSSLPATERRTYLPLKAWAKEGFVPLEDAKGQRFLVSEGSREHPIYLFSSNSVRPINDADQRNPAKVAEEEHGRMALAYAKSQGIKLPDPDLGPNV